MEITREKLLKIYNWDIVEQMMPFKEDFYFFKGT